MYNDFICNLKNIFKFFKYFNIFFPKYNIIILEGKRCLKITSYLTKTDNLFSNRFQAFWYYISKNNLKNNTIYSLKEYANSSNIYDDYGEPKRKKNIRNYDFDENNSYDDDNDEIINKDIFIVDQNNYFKLSNDIYCE